MGFVETLRGMSDAELLGSLDRAVGRGRRITAEVLAHLGEVEARRLYLGAACSSLFAYCTDRLRLDAGAAYKRILAARAARRFPMILQMVSDGALHLAGVGLLAPHLTPANHEELLAAATNKSKREIEALLADRAPKPPVPSRIRRLSEPSQPPGRQASLELSDPQRAATQLVEGAPETAQEPSSAPRAVTDVELGVPAVPAGAKARGSSSTSAPPSAPPQPSRPEPPAPRLRGTVDPLGNRRHRVAFTASDALVGTLERARALLSHSLQGSDIADVIELALTELVERLERERFGVRGSSKPRRRTKATTDAKRRAGRAGCGVEPGRPQVPEPPAGGREPAVENDDPRQDGSAARGGDRSGGEAEAPARASTTVPGDSSGGESDGVAGASTAVPRDSSRAPRGTRHVPMAVRRAVYERDGARCTHTDAEGHRCKETHHLQLDHIVPRARGGGSNLSNIRLLCAQHNLHAARRSFGPGLIDRRIEQARGGGR